MIYAFNAIDNSVEILDAIHKVMNEDYSMFETKDDNILRNDAWYAIISRWYRYGYTEFRDINYYIDIPKSKIHELIEKVCKRICVHNYDVQFSIVRYDEYESVADLHKLNVTIANTSVTRDDDEVSKVCTSLESKGTVFTLCHIFKEVVRNDAVVYRIYNELNKDKNTLSYLEVMSEVNRAKFIIADYLSNIDKVINHDSDYERGYIDKYNRLNIRFMFNRTYKENIFFKILYSHFKNDGYIVKIDSDTIDDETIDIITVVI